MPRLGEDRCGPLVPWLDELVALSIEDEPVANLHRMQALWISIAPVVVPYIATSPIRTSSTQRSTKLPSVPASEVHSPASGGPSGGRDAPRGPVAVLVRVRSRGGGHLSKSQVGRVFVEAFGQLPIAYLTMLRMERVAHLRRRTDEPIAIIARRVGWSNPDFAAQQFRRSVGVTPGRYRKVCRAAQTGG